MEGLRMYNEELKSQFINECIEHEDVKKRASSIFKASSKFEERAGKDICAMNELELVEVLEQVTGIRLARQTTDMSILRKYARWCLENNVHGSNDILLEAQSISYDRLKTVMVSSPAHLHERLNLVFPPETDCRPDNLCRGYFWLAYMGLREDEVPLIRSEHIDLKHMTLNFNDKKYPIYKESVPVIRYLCSANSFIYDYVKYEAVVERDSGTQILRGMKKGSGVNTASIRRLSSRRIQDCITTDEKIVLRFKSIHLSGVLYQMYMAERPAEEFDIEYFLVKYFGEIDSLSKKRIPRKATELLTDYKRWKTAFYS